MLHSRAPVFRNLELHFFSREQRGLCNRRAHFHGIKLSEVTGSCDAENRSVEVTVFVYRVFFSKIVLQEVRFAAG